MLNDDKVFLKNSFLANISVNIIILLGLIIAAIQFYLNRSIWIDEAVIALNINHRSPLGLLKPLDYNGVAPVLFLEMEHFFAKLFPNIEYGLRIFPFMCYLGALYFFFKLVKEILEDKLLIIFALSLFLFNPTFVYYSSEIKQYIGDVMVTCALLYFFFKKYNNSQNKYLILAIAGLIAVFLSNVAPIILFTIGIYLLYDNLLDKKNLIATLSLFFFWGVVMLTYFILFIYNHPTKDKMVDYWLHTYSFMPVSLSAGTFVLRKFYDIFFFLFYFGKIIGCGLVILFITGIICLIITKRFKIAALIFIPFATHLVLSAFKLYPFETRLYLYLTPILIIICAFGVDFFYKIIAHRFRVNKAFLLVISFFIPIALLRIIVIHPLPIIQHEDFRTSIDFINKKSKKRDNIYVAVSGELPFTYYKEMGYLKNDPMVIYGKYSSLIAGETKQNVIDLTDSGERVWVLFHDNGMQEEGVAVKMLKAKGYIKTEAFTSLYHTNAFLYKKP